MPLKPPVTARPRPLPWLAVLAAGLIGAGALALVMNARRPRELMVAILGRLRRSGIKEVRLTVEPGNRAAVLLYRSLGFRPEGPDGGLRRDYFGPGMDRQILHLDLAARAAAPQG